MLYNLACPPLSYRFGDSCYFAASSTVVDILTAMDLCGQNDSYLWWPESSHEISFVKNFFPSATGYYLTGIDQYVNGKGMIYSDGSYGVGLPFLTSKVGKCRVNV
jgi:hypothetical protein